MIFVSYKREDEQRVEGLVEELNSAGFTVDWDRNLAPGESWRAQIEAAVDRAKCVIVVWTRRSIGEAGKVVHEEAGRARRRGVLVPVMFEPVTPPLGFGDLHAIDMSGWRERAGDVSFQRLCDAVKTKLKSPSTATPGFDQAHDVPHRSKRAGKTPSGARNSGGFRRVYEDFPTKDFLRMLTNAGEVQILQTFIPIENHLRKFRAGLRCAIEGGCEVNILICHPKSEAVDIRAKALKCDRKYVQGQVEENIAEMQRLHAELDGKHRGRLSVKTYMTLPSMSIYQVDETFLYGSYYHGMLAIDAPQLRIDGRNTILGKRLLGEIQSIWGRGDSDDVIA